MLRYLAVGVLVSPAVSSAQTAFDFTFDGITGEPMPLSQYAGSALLITNTASRCGFTGQYEDLQTVWDRYRDRGLVVIGVPSDDFNQELATEAEIQAFCEVNFGNRLSDDGDHARRRRGRPPVLPVDRAAGRRPAVLEFQGIPDRPRWPAGCRILDPDRGDG